MPVVILLAFVLVPIAEIAVFIKAGEIIGLGWTLGVIVLTAMIGTALLRQQGLQVLAQVQQRLDRGEMPVGEMFDGLCLLVAGALLLTPGFLTDSVGFALFIPPLRAALGYFILKKVMHSRNARVWVNGQEMGGGPGGPGARGGGGGDGPIIDGTYTDVTGQDENRGKPGPGGQDSPWRRIE